jgi:hypothetical protein
MKREEGKITRKVGALFFFLVLLALTSRTLDAARGLQRTLLLIPTAPQPPGPPHPLLLPLLLLLLLL